MDNQRATVAEARLLTMSKPPYKYLDVGIRETVKVLYEAGIETFESCEGGKGHAFYEPTVRFHGGHGEGFRALAIALQHGLHVFELRRYYVIQNGEPTGPYWEITFIPEGGHPKGRPPQGRKQ